MTTITATPDQALAGVRLEVTKTSAVRRIIRHDINGSRAVRFHASQLPSPAPGVLAILDREAALVGEVRYDVDDGARGATAITVLDLALPWLTVPTLPGYGMECETVSGYTAAQDPLSTVHLPINRSTPLVTLGGLRSRAGVLTFVVGDHASARAITALVGRGEIMLLRQAEHAGMDMYFTPNGPVSTTTTDNAWEVSLDYVETGWPPNGLVNAPGWTFEDMAVSAETFEVITERYLTYNTLVQDVRI